MPSQSFTLQYSIAFRSLREIALLSCFLTLTLTKLTVLPAPTSIHLEPRITVPLLKIDAHRLSLLLILQVPYYTPLLQMVFYRVGPYSGTFLPFGP